MKEENRSKDLLLSLQMAIKLEQEGRELFAEAARKATGRHARQTFEFLKGEEDRHIERIRRFYESIERCGGTEPPDVVVRDTEKYLEAFNRKLAELRDDLKPTASDIEAYRFALSFENGAEQFYRQKMEETSNPNVKRFYGWLIQEEEMHSRVLTSCLNFAEDPAGWFKERQ